MKSKKIALGLLFFACLPLSLPVLEGEAFAKTKKVLSKKQVKKLCAKASRKVSRCVKVAYYSKHQKSCSVASAQVAQYCPAEQTALPAPALGEEDKSTACMTVMACGRLPNGELKDFPSPCALNEAGAVYVGPSCSAARGDDEGGVPATPRQVCAIPKIEESFFTPQASPKDIERLYPRYLSETDAKNTGAIILKSDEACSGNLLEIPPPPSKQGEWGSVTVKTCGFNPLTREYRFYDQGHYEAYRNGAAAIFEYSQACVLAESLEEPEYPICGLVLDKDYNPLRYQLFRNAKALQAYDSTIATVQWAEAENCASES